MARSRPRSASRILVMNSTRFVFGITDGGSLQQPAPTLNPKTPGTGSGARPTLDSLSPNVADPRAQRTIQAVAAWAGLTAEEQAMPLVDFVNLKVPSSGESYHGLLVPRTLVMAGV